MLKLHEIRQDNGLDLFEEVSDANHAAYLNVITYGKCVFWIQGSKVVAEKGDLLLIPGHLPFYWKSIPTVFHAKTVAAFNAETDTIGLPVLESSSYLHAKLGCYDWIHERLKELHDIWTEKLPYYDLIAQARLTEILVQWNREVDRGTIAPEKHRNVEMMKRYMQDQYRNKITKDDLAGIIRKSPNYTATLFRTVTGQTISEYVHALRTKTATYLISESQLTIGEISEYLGYSDVSYFNKTFKRITGKAPSEYLGERPSRTI